LYARQAQEQVQGLQGKESLLEEGLLLELLSARQAQEQVQGLQGRE